MKTWESYLAEHGDAALSDMVDFLRIPSISSLKEHKVDVEQAARWTADRLRQAGIENVQVLPTAGHPVVYGDWLHADGKPTVLIYGHFDVQPADPLRLWTNPPFEPTVRNGRVYARGAGDDKGNMLIPILVAEAFLKTGGKLPVNLKFIFEGQEEIGSPQFVPFVAEHKDLLAADLVISADGGQESEDQPVLLVGLEGPRAVCRSMFSARTPTCIRASTAARCPIRSTPWCASSTACVRPTGKITVPGFFDDVMDLTEEDRQQIAAVPFDAQKYFADLGVSEGFGEPGYTPVERAWARPTLEINGIWGGLPGRGRQDRAAERGARQDHLPAGREPGAGPASTRPSQPMFAALQRSRPQACSVEVTQLPGEAYPYLMPADHPANRLVGDVLTSLYGNPPYYVRMGGSVPVLVAFLKQLGVYTVTLAFALEDERHHAPDEFFRLSSFEKGKKAFGEVWEKIAEGGLK